MREGQKIRKKKKKIHKTLQCEHLILAIADVAVTKRHQWLNEIFIFFLPLHPGNQEICFQFRNSVMQYSSSILKDDDHDNTRMW